MSNKIKVAVIGYGHLGKWHCQKVEATGLANLVAIVEPFEKNQIMARNAHPEALVVSDFNEVSGLVDAVFIVTPTSLHFDLIKRVLASGKHCFCEKPMTSSFEQAEEISHLLKNKKLVFQVGHSERCHQIWDEVKAKLDLEKGPLQIRLNRYAAFKGRATDVDVVQDLMIHDIDLLRYLFKKKMTSVKSWGLKMRSNHWDHVTSLFEFSDGSMATITVGRSHIREVRELEVLSSQGCFVVDLFHSHYIHNSVSNTDVDLKEFQKRDHLFIEHQFFYQSILNDEPVFVGIEDGVSAVNIVQKVLESLETQTSVVLGD